MNHIYQTKWYSHDGVDHAEYFTISGLRCTMTIPFKHMKKNLTSKLKNIFILIGKKLVSLMIL